MSQNAKYTINAQQRIYANHPKKTLKEDFTASHGGLSRSSPFISGGGFSEQSEERLDLVRGGQRDSKLFFFFSKNSKLFYLKGGHQAQVH